MLFIDDAEGRRLAAALNDTTAAGLDAVLSNILDGEDALWRASIGTPELGDLAADVTADSPSGAIRLGLQVARSRLPKKRTLPASTNEAGA